MKKPHAIFATLCLVGCCLSAQNVPPPDRLLPADIFGMLTIPDMGKVRRQSSDAPMSRLWQDPALRPFREHFVSKLRQEVLGPLEQEMGIPLTNFLGLVQGQFTLAVTRNNYVGLPEDTPGVVLLMDAGDQSSRLAELLADLKGRWTESGAPMRSQSIRGVDFSVLVMETPSLEDVLDEDGGDPLAEEEPGEAVASKPLEILVGQSGSLLVVGNAPGDIEKIIGLKQGATVMALAESDAYLDNYNQLFRDATMYGWINVTPFVEIAKKKLAESADPDAASNPFAPQPERILRGLGLFGLKTLAFASHYHGSGTSSEFFVGVPEMEREGLFRILEIESKDAAPPTFVPDDVITFSRTRINLTQMWNSLERVMGDIMPPLAAGLRMGIESAGKQQDPTFDLRRDLIEILGDDLVYWQKAPNGGTLAEISSPPTIYLMGSPSPDRLMKSLRTLLSPMLSQLGGEVEREFLGRQILTFQLPPMESPDGGEPKPREIALTVTGGYLAIATDSTLMEEFIRSADGISNPLRSKPGIGPAVDRAGGFGQGLFGYSNDKLYMQMFYKFLKGDSQGGGGLEQLLNMIGMSDAMESVKEWADPALLPDFESIEQYFHFSVQTGQMDREGFRIKVFMPHPPNYRN